MPLLAWLLIPVAYALGMFPSAVLVARAKGRDVYGEGSGNPGTSNVARLLGWKYALLVFVLDFLKGTIAAGVGLALFGRPAAWAFGIAAIVGHMLPVIYRFKGGKGVATGAGALLVLFPWVVLIEAGVWLLVAKGARKASLASLAVAVSFPFFAWFGPWPCSVAELVVLCVLAVLVIARHATNLRRLIKGEELVLDSDAETTSD